MREAHDRARGVLEARRAQMDTMAHVLLERETVEGEIVNALLDDRWDEYVAAHPEEASAPAGAAAEKDAAPAKDAAAEKDGAAEKDVPAAGEPPAPAEDGRPPRP